MSELALEIVGGEGKGTIFRLLGETAMIGRSADCDICLDTANGISRQHAQLFRLEGQVRVKDMGSQNGTLVDGTRVSEATIVPGSKIKIGTVTLKLVHRRASSRAMARSQNAAPAAAGEQGLAAAPENAPAAYGEATSEVEAMAQVMGEGSGKFLLTILIVLGLIVVGMYALHYAEFARFDMKHFALVAQNEERVVNFHKQFENYSTPTKDEMGRQIIRAERYNGMLHGSLERLRNMPHVYPPPPTLLVVRGLRQGDGTVVLKTGSGTPIPDGTYPILCRGYIEPGWRRDEDMPRDRARAMAEEARKSSVVLEKDGHLYAACEQLQLAADMYNGPANEPNLGQELHTNARLMRRKLAQELAEIFERAMAEAFPPPRSGRERDFGQAYRILEEAKVIIRDEDSLDWQVIEIWQAEMRRLNKRFD